MTNTGIAQSKIAVVLADPNSLTRECFALCLESLSRGMDVLAVPSLKEAVDAVQDQAGQPERGTVMLCNIGSTPLTGDMAANVAEAVAACDPMPLVILSEQDDIDMILEALRLGVRGFIVANLGLGVTMEAIRLVAAGGTFVPATALHKLTAPAPRLTLARSAETPVADGKAEGIGGLTPREMAVLNCLREGKSNKIIAYKLGMCENTAKAHVRNVLKKLGATNRTEAAYLAHTRLSGAMTGAANQH